MGVTFSSLSSWMASLMFWARQEELKIMMLGLDRCVCCFLAPTCLSPNG